jgi:hypothetical protein
MEKLETLPISVPILIRRKVNRRKLKPIIKISSTRKIKHYLPKKTVAHQKKMKKMNQSLYLWG